MGENFMGSNVTPLDGYKQLQSIKNAMKENGWTLNKGNKYPNSDIGPVFYICNMLSNSLRIVISAEEIKFDGDGVVCDTPHQEVCDALRVIVEDFVIDNIPLESDVENLLLTLCILYIKETQSYKVAQGFGTRQQYLIIFYKDFSCSRASVVIRPNPLQANEILSIEAVMGYCNAIISHDMAKYPERFKCASISRLRPR